MTPVRALLVVSVISSVLALDAAQPPAALQSPGKPGTIRGRIIDSGTGRPLARARVSLIAPAAGVRPVMTTGTNPLGIYELRDVAPGAYVVSAVRAGYIDLQYGQRRARERGVAVEVRGGQVSERIDIALPRGGVIAGRITDELGHPYPGVRVMALELRFREGRLSSFPGGTVMTDDLGRYRMAGLLPGSYQVSASSSETWRNEKQENTGYAATYYPGALSDAAQAVTLGVSQQRLDVDFSLTAMRTATVRGRVLSAGGQPLPGATIRMPLSLPGNPGLIMAGSTLAATTASDGSFELRDVPPASYLLQAAGSGGSVSQYVSVNGDIDDLVLVPRVGSTVTGRVVTDEGASPPFSASGVRVFLQTPDPNRVLPTVRLPAVNSDFTFTLSSLGGPFFFRLMGLPEGWMLDAVRLGERDLTDVPFDVPTGGRQLDGLELVVTEKVGTIAGAVVSADGTPTDDATVVLFAEDEAHWLYGSRFMRSARPTARGAFSVTGLPAGTYLAVARGALMDGEWESPEFMERVRREAVRVVLPAGGTATIELTVPPPQ